MFVEGAQNFTSPIAELLLATALAIDYCSLIGRKNLDVNKAITQEDRPSAFKVAI